MMQRLPEPLVRYWKLTVLFMALAAIYIWQTLAMTPDSAVLRRYHITAGQLHALDFTVIVPYMLIWAAALMGYLWLHSYAGRVGKSREGRGFRYLSWGMLAFAVWLPLSTILSSAAAAHYQTHPGATADMIRFSNYTNLLCLFIGYLLVYAGSWQLLKAGRIARGGMSQLQTVLFIVFGALYVLVTLHDPARRAAVEPGTTATYYQSDWLIVVTIIIPRLVGWYLGLTATANILLYQQKVKGTIYRQALRYLSYGLTVIIMTTIVLRFIQSMSVSLVRLNLGVLLLIIYALLVVLAGGCLWVCKGARRLEKIEET